jgi:O-acetylserine/cysteine efflux transporter
MADHKPLTALDGAGLLLASAIWGGSLVVAKIGMTDLSPLVFVTMRFVLGTILLLPLLRLPLKRAPEMVLLSFTMGGLHFVAMFAGVDGIDAASASIILLVEVPLAALLAAIFHRDYLGWRRALGMVVALAGVAIVIGQPRFEGSYVSVLLVITGAALWACGAVQLKSLASQFKPLELNAWVTLFSLPQLLVATWLMEPDAWQQVRSASIESWAAIAYQAVIVTFGAYWLWNRAMSRYDVNQTVPFTLTVPVYGVALGALVLGETITPAMIVGGILTMLGVAGVVLTRRRAAANAAGAE